MPLKKAELVNYQIKSIIHYFGRIPYWLDLDFYLTAAGLAKQLKNAILGFLDKEPNDVF